MMDQSRPSFTMRGARNAISQGLLHIEAQVNAIENAVSDNPGLAFDLAKTLVESTCRTILTERGVSWANGDDLPKLFQKVRDSLPMLPYHESQENDVRQSIVRTLGGLNTAIQGIAELRNQLTFASHGSDRPRPSMNAVYAVLAAQAADTIVGFLYDIHSQDRAAATGVESSPTRNIDFDANVDDQYGIVSILEVDFFPSEILFQIEPQSYRVLLEEFLNQALIAEEEA